MAGIGAGVFRAALAGSATPALLVCAALAAAIIAAFASVYVRNVRIEADSAGIRTFSIINDRNTITAHRIARVVIARAVSTPLFGTSARLAVLDANGAALLRLDADVWRAEKLLDASIAWSDRIEIVDEPMTSRQLTDRHPMALPFRLHHSVLFVLCVVGGVCAVLALATSF